MMQGCRAFLCLLLCSLVASKQYEPSRFFLDWDGTVAVTESFLNLPAAAYASNTSFQPPWSYFDDLYAKDYGKFSTSFGARANLSEELRFRSSLERRRVEMDSFDRTKNSGLFEGIRLQELIKVAKDVQLRDGFWEFVDWSAGKGMRPTIISLNWSVSWLRTILRVNFAARPPAAREMDPLLPEQIPIYCAEILPKNVVAKSRHDHPTALFTGADKVRLIAKLIRGDENVVFVGDTLDDLPPLYLAPTQLGVIAGNVESMTNTLQKDHVSVYNLTQLPCKGITQDNSFLYRMQSFTEINEYIHSECESHTTTESFSQK